MIGNNMTKNFTGPLEDRMAIREVLETYADAVNKFDGETWASLWTEDSQWDLPDYPELGTFHGKQSIVEMWHNAMPNYPKLTFNITIGSICIEGDTATTRSYISEVYDDPETGKAKRAQGEYNDRLIKQDGEWYLQHRTFRVRHQT